MKKTIIPMALLSLALLNASCGGKKEEAKKEETTNTSSADTANTAANTAVVEAPKSKVKDYAYFENLIKAISLDGAQLSQYYSSSDTTSKTLDHTVRVTNGKEAGFDMISFRITRPANYMGEQQEKMQNYDMESFKYFMNLNREKNAGKVNEKEYKSGETIFYYGLTKNIKGSMGSKDKSMMTTVTKINDLIISYDVSVNDLKSDMSKAEEVSKKIADVLAKSI
jgi:hypothetical protein